MSPPQEDKARQKGRAMGTQTAPQHYERSYVGRMRSTLRDLGPPVFDTAYLGVVETDTFSSWEQVRRLLAGIDTLSRVKDSCVYSITRVEFFWGHSSGEQGAVFFDNRLKAQLHVMHAVLGQGGAGPALCELILQALGVPQEMFNEANSAIPNNCGHTVIFSREQIGKVEGVDTALPYGEVGEWSWWMV